MSNYKSPCKKCRASQAALVTWKGIVDKPIEEGTLLTFTAGYEMQITYSCLCKDYIPSDNLEWMEWQYNKLVGNNR